MVVALVRQMLVHTAGPGQRITPLCPELKRLGAMRMLLSLDQRRCVLPVPDKVLHLPSLCRYPDSGADLPGQGSVCQAGAGGGSSRRGSHGYRDPELHHQGTPRCRLLCCGAPGSTVGAAQQSLALASLLQLAERLGLTACPSPPGVSMTAAAACPVSRQLGEEHPVSCLCKHSSWRELADNRASGESEGRCQESPPLPVTPVSVWQQADMARSDPGLTAQVVALSLNGKGARWSCSFEVVVTYLPLSRMSMIKWIT